MAIRVQRIIHVNLNVSALTPAAKFFTDTLGLQSISLMRAEPQDGSAMGLEGLAQWNGQSIHGVDHLWDSTMIDLLEWPLPPGYGRAYASPANIGISRLAIRVPDASACHRQCSEGNWISPISAPLANPSSGETFFCGRNPDGSLIEIIEGGQRTELWYININVSHLRDSARWYETVLGFRPVSEFWSQSLPGTAYGLEGKIEFESIRLQLPGREYDCGIQLQQWHNPEACGSPYDQPHHNGFYRMAMAVDDVQLCLQQLQASDVTCPFPPAWLDMGPDIPVDGVKALFFYDPDGACVELIQNPDFNV